MEKNLQEENERLKSILSKLLPNSGDYFICGEGGLKDRNGLPETLLICAAFGSDAVYLYKRIDQ